LVVGTLLGLAVLGLVTRLVGGARNPSAEAASGTQCVGVDPASPLKTGPQGVPFRVWSEDGSVAFFAIGGEGSFFDTYTIGLEAGWNEFTLPLPPGSLSFGCLSRPLYADDVDLESLQVVDIRDPGGNWASPLLACDDPAAWTVGEVPVALPGHVLVGTPIRKVAESELGWLRESDQLQPAMYADGPEVNARVVVRAGVKIARVVRVGDPDADQEQTAGKIHFAVCEDEAGAPA
jgi:hypothetical protein